MFVSVISGVPGDRGARPRGFRGREGDVRASESLVLLHHARAGDLWHQPHLGGEHDETPGRRFTYAGVPEVSETTRVFNLKSPENKLNQCFLFCFSAQEQLHFRFLPEQR